MEAVKLNVFHWHLSDDQGFRAESKKFPLLQEKGSDGLYYTQDADSRSDRIRARPRHPRRSRVRYAVPHHVVVRRLSAIGERKGAVPNCAQVWRAGRRNGSDEGCAPTNSSIHSSARWPHFFPISISTSAAMSATEKNGMPTRRFRRSCTRTALHNNAALQAYFTGRVQKIVASHHKIMEGWDEVLQPKRQRMSLIQSWRGLDRAGRSSAAREPRHAFDSATILNLNQPASEHYLADPLGGDAASLTAEQKARILGGEATCGVNMSTPENIDSRIWPRIRRHRRTILVSTGCAGCSFDVSAAGDRLGKAGELRTEYRLATLNVMLQRMSGESDPVALKVLGGGRATARGI